ncbi:ABC-type multidrug transport system fused ATPase/permease subunit [Kineococcus xinjiangensis]|uniref:ABC-type multidrug transport system fused ATPase/permease subunit n=1 Tax=Kineococcus xinjiangensis TaxID=512762 RepID=A0A2S6IT98_9ACTN|nr:ABC transporter ATP-binding protein [Kineococcus xinjiangensis]PPK97266.1 ABC-type multidrug transport system fused ATPase/permease subunit [Kineococcus xinjiangensis]
MTQTVRRLRRLFGRHRARWYLLSLLVVLTSAMEALAAALVFALVSLLASGTVTLPLLGTFTTTGDDLGVFAACVVGVFVVRAATVVLHDSVLYRLCYGAGAELEQELLGGYLSLPPRELRRRGRAQLVRNVHDTVMTVVEECLLPSVLALGSVLRIVGIVAVMAATSPVATLVAGLVFAPLLWFVSHLVRRPVRRLGEVVEASLAESLRTATETLDLAGEIRMAGRSEDFSRRFGDVRRRIARAGGAEEVIRGVPRLAAETVLVLFVVGYAGLATVRGDAAAVLPTLGLFAYAALRVLPSLIGLVGLVHSVALSAPAVETVLADEGLLRAGGRGRGAGPAPERISLRGVGVTVPETGRTVLRDVDLDLHRGDVVAVVGPNGAGKSTLVDVLAGALAPAAGSVSADGRPLEELGAEWAAQVAMVPQHVHLLDSDVLTNITLDLSGRSAQDPRVAEVVRAVGLQPVIDRLEGRTVGEDGRMLSGGERQRVAVARALHRRAGVLLVDEGTSALDTTARAAIAELVAVGREDRITVLVTHDPELARTCSRVVRVEGGRAWAVEPVAGPS